MQINLMLNGVRISEDVAPGYAAHRLCAQTWLR